MLDKIHLWRALRYVERNPVRAKMARVAWRYLWSSASAHVTGGDPTGLVDLAAWRKTWRPETWRSALRRPEEPSEVSAIRLGTHRGRLLAGDGFLSKLEHRLGRRLCPLPVGRPKKSKPPQKVEKETDPRSKRQATEQITISY